MKKSRPPEVRSRKKVPKKTEDIARGIRLLILDVDGVLTEGSIILDNDGNEYKSFHVRDGHGIKMLIHSGIHVAIITGRHSKVVDGRRNSALQRSFRSVLTKGPPIGNLLNNMPWKTWRWLI